MTVNSVTKPDAYTLPRVDDIFTVLAGETIFLKLDLAHAYQKLEPDDASKKFTTINTRKELF